MSQIDPIEQPVEQNTPLDPLDKSYLFAPAASPTNQTRHLTHLQHRAALLLAQGLSYPHVAVQLNVGRATLYRWRNDPHFHLTLRQQQLAERAKLYGQASPNPQTIRTFPTGETK